jgi:hypothetical protein
MRLYDQPLQDQFQREGEFQLPDDDGRGLAVANGDEIAAANLPLHLEAEPFEEALHRKIEARFQEWPSGPGEPVIVIRGMSKPPPSLKAFPNGLAFIATLNRHAT